MTAIRMLMVMTALCGFIYPLAITVVAKWAFPRQAGGSLVLRDGHVTGSELIGRQYDDPRYFWPRPSATRPFPYNAAASSGSNLGPLSVERERARKARLRALREADPSNMAPVPEDLITASGSGLDPHISPAAAAFQAGRVARLRGIGREKIDELIRRRTTGRQFGFLGQPAVNVVLLNQDLDSL